MTYDTCYYGYDVYNTMDPIKDDCHLWSDTSQWLHSRGGWVFYKAMHSVNIIEYLIIIRIESNILQIFRTDYNTIISVFLHVSKMTVFCVSQNFTKQIAKIIVFLAFGSDKNTCSKAKTDIFRLKMDIFRLKNEPF